MTNPLHVFARAFDPSTTLFEKMGFGGSSFSFGAFLDDIAQDIRDYNESGGSYGQAHFDGEYPADQTAYFYSWDECVREDFNEGLSRQLTSISPLGIRSVLDDSGFYVFRDVIPVGERPGEYSVAFLDQYDPYASQDGLVIPFLPTEEYSGYDPMMEVLFDNQNEINAVYNDLIESLSDEVYDRYGLICDDEKWDLFNNHIDSFLKASSRGLKGYIGAHMVAFAGFESDFRQIASDRELPFDGSGNYIPISGGSYSFESDAEPYYVIGEQLIDEK